MIDQAETLRRMARGAKPAASVITVTSGKGGVGKTNVAANLAICLAASGKRVVLFDADLGLANVDVLFNIRPRRTLADFIMGNHGLDEIMQTGPGGVRLICGASGLSGLADLGAFQRERLIREMTTLQDNADYLIFDTGAGISSDVMCFAHAADHCLVVTTPDPAAMTDAYAVIKSLSRQQCHTRISLLPNMVESRLEARKIYHRVASVSQRFLDVPVYHAGYVLTDEHVPLALRQRGALVLLYPRCQASYCLMALAGKLSHVAGAVRVESGFFRKVANWLF